MLWLDISIKDSTTLFSASILDLSTAGFLALLCSSLRLPSPDCDIAVGRGLFFIGRVLFGVVLTEDWDVSIFTAVLSTRVTLVDCERLTSFADGVSCFFGMNRRSCLTASFPSRIGRKHRRSSLTCEEELTSLHVTSFFSRQSFFGFETFSIAAPGSFSVSRERVLMDDVTSHHIVERSSLMRQTLHVGISRLLLPFEAKVIIVYSIRCA